MTPSRLTCCAFNDSGVTIVAAVVRVSSVPVPELALGAYCLVGLFLANSCQSPKQLPHSLVFLIQDLPGVWARDTASLDLCVVASCDLASSLGLGLFHC